MAALKKVPGRRRRQTFDERVEAILGALSPLDPTHEQLQTMAEGLIGERIIDKLTPAQRSKLEARLAEGRRG